MNMQIPLQNPIANWNHRLPALVCAALVTGLVLAGIAQLAEPDLNGVAAPIVATQQQVKASV